MPLRIRGELKRVSFSFAAASLGTYTAEDVISAGTTGGTACQFTQIARGNATGGYITDASVLFQTTGVVPSVSLYLYNGIPTSNLNDNGASTGVLYADVDKYIGKIDFAATEELGGTGVSETKATASTVGNLPMPFICANDCDDLFGILVTRNALVIGTASNVVIRLTAEQQ